MPKNKKSEPANVPTLEETNPDNKYKRFLALGTVLSNRLDNVQEGDVVGIRYKGLNDNGGIQPYHDYNIKVQKDVVKDRLSMTDLLDVTADDISLQGNTPLIGVVIEVAEFTTAYGPVRSITVCTDLNDIHPAEPEPF